MKRIALSALIVVGLGGMARAADPSPRSTPEAQGISSRALLEFVAEVNKIEQMHSLMIVRHGQVVAEGWWAPYSAGSRHSLYSLSKSFTSTALGMAIAEGKLSVDDPVLKFFPEDAPGDPSKNLRAMRISDLLRMSTGQSTEPTRGPDQVWTQSFLNHPVPNKPGTHFLYNTSATYMVSAILQKVTGQTVRDYLAPRLFEPLGIELPPWEASPQGISVGGSGLSVHTEDIAKFGQLYLQKGRWQGKTLVPEEWVDRATARQTSNGSDPKSDWEQGYGYQFWRCRNGAYRGDGAFGQYCVVLPDQDAVIAITSSVKDMQAPLNLIWDKLLPAMKPSTLPPDEAATAELKSTLAKLTVPTQEGSATPASHSARTYEFPANPRKIEAVTLEPGTVQDSATLAITIDGKTQKIPCGKGTWTKTRAGFGPLAEQTAAASGAWTAGDTYQAKICFYETPFAVTLRMIFDGDRVKLDTKTNVGFGPTSQPELVGTAK